MRLPDPTSQSTTQPTTEKETTMTTNYDTLLADIAQEKEVTQKAHDAHKDIMRRLYANEAIIRSVISKLTNRFIWTINRIDLPTDFAWIKEFRKKDSQIITEDGEIYILTAEGTKVLIHDKFINGSDRDVASATRATLYVSAVEHIRETDADNPLLEEDVRENLRAWQRVIREMHKDNRSMS